VTRRTARSIIRRGVVAVWTDRDLIRTTGHAPGQILGEAQCALQGRGRMTSATVTRAGPLTGWVDSTAEWAAVDIATAVITVRAAWSAPGVTTVQTRIAIAP
jgi:hypothetical protein